MKRVEIVEVGPRDGLQPIPTFVPTETKVELIRRLIGAGVQRLEIGSFVSPKHVPQMADMAEVVARLGPLDQLGARAIALVPNRKGAELAMQAGLTEIAYVISATESHNQSNVRRSIQDSLDDLRTIVEMAPDLRMRVGLACCFDCPFEGRTPEDTVLRNIERILAIRSDVEVGIADTTGMALPQDVGRLAARCVAAFPEVRSWVFHGHDTSGFGVANAFAAHEAGIGTIDAAIAGLGGCPFAPGATGNVATEDTVYAFERAGVATGIDLDRLLDVAEFAARLPDGTTGGHVRVMPRKRVLASLHGKAAA